MADEKQLELLKKGVAGWNDWRKENAYKEIDLSEANLVEANLMEADLGDANLRGTDLSGAYLNEAKLSDADLSGANLSGAILSEADLSEACLNKVDLSGANLSAANLSEANLSEANLMAANLTDAIVTDANLSEANLSEAYLRDANLRRADLTGTDLSDAILRAANLSEADLAWANVNRANLSGANLRLARLCKADLSGANLSYANLIEANLTGANLSKTIVRATIFGDTSLDQATDLESCVHLGPSTLDHRTLERSGMLPIVFLRGCGLPERLIDYLPSLLGEAIAFYSCFISYNHTDKVFARRLHDQLQGQGIRCWLDEHQLKPGDDIYEGIDRGIRLWDKVLLCCSKASLSSWWVEREVDTAIEKEQQLSEKHGQQKLAIIPLNLDGHLFDWTGSHAATLRKRLAADFTGWEQDNAKFEAQFESVVAALRSDEQAREKPPEPKL